MAPFEYTRIANHPYKRTSEKSHGHFAPTALRHPAYSAPTLPFAWMLQEAMKELGEIYGLDIQVEREPDLGFKTQWIQDRDNQKALLAAGANRSMRTKPVEGVARATLVCGYFFP